jgi:hypothetical protein
VWTMKFNHHQVGLISRGLIEQGLSLRALTGLHRVFDIIVVFPICRRNRTMAIFRW